MKPLLFVCNPKAGRGLRPQQLTAILSGCSERGYLVTVYLTKAGYCFDELRSCVTEDTIIVYAGGDGMLNAAVNFQMDNKTQSLNDLADKCVIYLPLGTTNDFARNLNLTGRPEALLGRLLDGTVRRIDIGKLNERYFVYVAAFGMMTDVSYTAPQDLKNSFGYFAYLLEGLKRVSELRSWRLKICANDQLSEETRIEGDFILGMITNSVSVAGFRNFFSGKVSLSDGFFEVFLLKRPKSILDLSNAAAAFLSPKNHVPDVLLRFKTNKLTIESAEPLNWTLDGEYGGEFRISDIEVFREKITVACPE